MAIKRLSGQSGSVVVNGVTLGVTGWKLNRAYNNVDATITTSGGWEEFVPVTRSWTVEITVPYDANGVNMDIGIEAITHALNGAPVACSFILGNGGKTYTGSGILESYSVDDQAKDIARVTFTIKGTGALL